MPADLDGVRRKLARARSKLDALSTGVAAYMDPPPFEIAVAAQGNRQAIICRISRDPDESWADEMAEIAYQARSALDVLVPQLVIDNGGTPGRTQFPIFVKRDDYMSKGRGGKSNRDRMLDGVAPRHRRLIDDVQPFQRGRGAERDPLAVLATISKRDKHNDVYVCVAAIGNPTIKLIRPQLPPPDREITIRFGSRFRPYPMRDGEEFFAIDRHPDAAAASAPMSDDIYLETPDLQATLGFLSGGDTFTLADLDRAVLATAQIVNKCATRLRS
jgi:hypothetical protein